MVGMIKKGRERETQVVIFLLLYSCQLPSAL